MAVAYALLCMLFVVHIVLTFGGILQQGEDAAVQAWAAQAPAQPAASGEPAQPNGPAAERPNASPAESPDSRADYDLLTLERLVAHSGQSSQLVFNTNDRNARFLPKLREALQLRKGSYIV